jgi:hypothetical protein
MIRLLALAAALALLTATEQPSAQSGHPSSAGQHSTVTGHPSGRAQAREPASSIAPASSIDHPATGHEVHLSAPAIAVDREGPLVAWMTQESQDNIVYVARPGGERVRVTPAGLSGDSLHQAPGLVVGPGAEIYVTWASRRPKPEGGLFASDLQLSRSLDGGQTFDAPLRMNADFPTSHSFEGLTVTPDGTVVVAWIETRSEPGGPQLRGPHVHGDQPHTYLARVTERGSRVERITKLDDDETCVCCRVSLASAKPDDLAIAWRKVFPGDIRDMVLALSRDGGRRVAPATRIHADNWRITACPHRGGSVAIDGRGRVHAVWYTEGTRNEPAVLYATAEDGRRFGAPRRVHVSSTSIPDHPRLAVDASGRALIVWEDATAVRRRVLMRETTASGLGPVRVLSQAIKAYAPDMTVSATGDAFVAWHEEQFPRTKTIVMRVTGRAPESKR